MKKAKGINKLIVLVMLITMVFMTMGVSSWLIISETPVKPSLLNFTYITPTVSLSTTPIYETETLTAKSDVPGTFYYGTTALEPSITTSTVNTNINIKAPTDVSGTEDEIPVQITFVVDENYLTNNKYRLESSNPIAFEAKLKAVAYRSAEKGIKYSSIQSARPNEPPLRR